MVSPPFYQGPPHSYFGPPFGSLKQRAAIKALKWQYGLYGNPLSALAVGTGNYLTRAYRQKPVVGLTNYRGNMKAIKSSSTEKSSTQNSSAKKTKNKILFTNMAYRRRRSFRPRRPRGASRRYRRRRIRPVIGIPKHRIVKLKTVGYYQHDPAAGGGISVGTIKLNSAYDPTGDHGAGQPLYFDEYATLYLKYVVLGYKVQVTAITADNTVPVIVGFTPKADSTTLSSWLHYKELSGTVQKMLSPDVDRAWLSVKGSVKKWLEPAGGSLLSDQSAQAQVTADPTNLLYGHLYVQAVDAASDSGAIKFVFTITQIVKFFHPRVPARS